MATICPPLPCSCYRPAAGATLQGLCRKGYAAHAPTAALATQIGTLQLLHWPHRSACPTCCTGPTDRHAPSAALATQIGMLQLLHWPHGSACSNCCTGHADKHAPAAAQATHISMLQVLHWPRRSACSKCCTGHTAQQAPSVALATQITMLQPLHWPQGSACSTCTAAPLLKVGRAQRGSVLYLLTFCCVLHQCGNALQRSASIWDSACHRPLGRRASSSFASSAPRLTFNP